MKNLKAPLLRASPSPSVSSAKSAVKNSLEAVPPGIHGFHLHLNYRFTNELISVSGLRPISGTSASFAG